MGIVETKAEKFADKHGERGSSEWWLLKKGYLAGHRGKTPYKDGYLPGEPMCIFCGMPEGRCMCD